jgi:hypothetical protein
LQCVQGCKLGVKPSQTLYLPEECTPHVLEGAHFEGKKGGRLTLLPVKVKISYMASTSDAEATVLMDEGGNIAWDMTPTQVHGQFKVKIPALVWSALNAAISSDGNCDINSIYNIAARELVVTFTRHA